MVNNGVCIDFVLSFLPSCTQANGLALTPGAIALVLIMSVIAAGGAASLPLSALVSMIAVLDAVELSVLIPQLSLLLSVDWCAARCCAGLS
jgi:Na+/H+-dicarboxylate symporter